jgi:hypothetical protein
MALTEAGCRAICTVLGDTLPACVADVWGHGQECGASPYSGCVAVETPTPTPTPSPTPAE